MINVRGDDSRTVRKLVKSFLIYQKGALIYVMHVHCYCVSSEMAYSSASESPSETADEPHTVVLIGYMRVDTHVSDKTTFNQASLLP